MLSFGIQCVEFGGLPELLKEGRKGTMLPGCALLSCHLAPSTGICLSLLMK